VEWHPFSKPFPMLDGEQIEALAADIAENGLREPIIVDSHNRIIDGRNRSAACLLAGVSPKFELFAGSDAEVLKLVISLNLHRRHLTESQRAMVAAEVANIPKHAHHPVDDGQICPSGGVSVKQAAEALSVSPRQPLQYGQPTSSETL
jgi:hypothetical protein